MEFLKTFFSYNFQFVINRVQLEKVDYAFGIFAVICLVLAVGFKLWSVFSRHQITKQLLRRFFKLSLTVGLLGIVWCGARYENVEFFGSHFAFLLIIIIGGIWKSRIMWYLVTKYRKEKAVYDKEQMKQKYLR